MTRPPRTRPNHTYIISYRSLAVPDLSSTMAMKMNRGIATNVNFSIVPQVWAATM